MTKKINSQDKKRHGQHHKQGRKYQHVYLPYLPAILLIVASLVMGGLRLNIARTGVLAYATEMSSGNLLSATNQQRANSGVATLTLNSKLSQAAQAKANDMVERDYWSHNTPDGKEPWTFISQAGYSYQKAGENLAYGFATSNQTVTGWMNSPSHKANMLDSAFTEVGFGYKNGDNYQSSGNQTVVVAMYAKPQVASASSPEPSPSTSPAPSSSSSPPAPAPAASPAPSKTKSPGSQPVTQPQSTTSETAEKEKTDEEKSALQSSDQDDETKPVALATTQKPITKGQTLISSGLPWATFASGIISGTAVTVLFVNHGLRFRKLLRQGEKFILHHPVLDTTMISLVIFAITLSQNIGVIL